MIVTAIGRAVERENLSEDLARASMEQILAGEATAAQIAALAIALRMKGENAEEIAGMARAMRKFNISTTVAIVAASCGVAVAKHGNRAISSRTGSADVLEALGVRVDLTPESAGRSLDHLGITFLFAPNYHSAMRNAAGARREMGVRTVFNLLGPLTNPAGATRQLLGVYADAYVPILAEVLRQLGSERAMIVHGSDGMDELTVFGKSHVAELKDGKVKEYALDPQEYGLAHTDRAAVSGGNAQENAARVRAILGGAKGPARDIVLLNAGAALVVAGVAPDLGAGIERARTAIDRGDAARKLDELAAFRG
jgi:anthranilate phosphoribosyltransferase